MTRRLSPRHRRLLGRLLARRLTRSRNQSPFFCRALIRAGMKHWPIPAVGNPAVSLVRAYRCERELRREGAQP